MNNITSRFPDKAYFSDVKLHANSSDKPYNQNFRLIPPSSIKGNKLKTLDSFPPFNLLAFSEASRASHSMEYALHRDGKNYYAYNPTQHLHVTFNANKVQFEHRDNNRFWSMYLAGYGYEGTLTPVASPEPSIVRNRLEYRRGSLTEWYLNGPSGFEQGFTLLERPENDDSGKPLVLALNFSGDLTPVVADERQALNLMTSDGIIHARYGHLCAVDATGRRLPSHLENMASKSYTEHQIHVVVDDHWAVYPILIDPLVQEEDMALNLSETVYPALGPGVAIDGKTAVAISSNAIYVFVNDGHKWARQASPLIPNGSTTLRGSVSIRAEIK